MKIKAVLLPRKIISQPIPPLDLAMAAAVIKKHHSSWSFVDLLDANFKSGKYNEGLKNFNNDDIFSENNKAFLNRVLKDIGDIGMDLIYFYIEWWKATLPLALALALRIKRSRPQTRILLSGPYLNAYGRPLLQEYPYIDYIADSEIEPVLDGLVEHPYSPRHIPNILWMDKRLKRVNKNARVIADLDRIPVAIDVSFAPA
jgi:radical SAM superfamily enzyme YgiQ (UPF0313 family)